MEENLLIPPEEVWEDMGSDDGMVAQAAYCYWMEHYATPEQKELLIVRRKQTLLKRIRDWFAKVWYLYFVK